MSLIIAVHIVIVSYNARVLTTQYNPIINENQKTISTKKKFGFY